MDGDRNVAVSHRLMRLVQKMHQKTYRERYVEAHTRQFLARQMREFRGAQSQAEFAVVIDRKQTVVSRLEDPAYTGWTLRTLFEVASKLDVAVLVRFVSFPDFLNLSAKFDDKALKPKAYSEAQMDTLGSQGSQSMEPHLVAPERASTNFDANSVHLLVSSSVRQSTRNSSGIPVGNSDLPQTRVGRTLPVSQIQQALFAEEHGLIQNGAVNVLSMIPIASRPDVSNLNQLGAGAAA